MKPSLPAVGLLSLFVGLLVLLPARADLHYKGSVKESDKTLVRISSSNGFNKWCAVGDVVEGFKVQSLSTDGNELTLAGADSKPLVLSLEKAPVKLVTTSDGLIPLDQLNWKWIKSAENPMKTMPEDLPLWAITTWQTMAADIKTDLLNYYRVHGWEIDVDQSPKSREHSFHVSNRRLRDPSEPQLTFEQLKAQGKLKSVSPLKKG